jgi:predicted dehydrogenase
MTPLNIAVMGAGLIGKRHAEHVLAHADTTLSAIIDPSESAQTFAENLGTRWYKSFADIEASNRPQGVIIATPNQLHVENALEVIAQGIPALVEKPIADNAAAACDMVNAAIRADVPILVGHHRRHNPMIRKAKELLDSGTLGQVLAVHGVFWVMKPDDYFDVTWRRQEGAGPVLVNLIHDIDLFRYLFGEIATVHALTSNAVRHNAVEETCVVTVRFASGVLGTLNVSDSIVSPWSWEMTTGENPSFPQQDAFCYQIGGTHGSLSIPQLELWKNPGKRDWLEPQERSRIPFEPADPLDNQLQHFCDVIQGVVEPLVSGREGLATLTVIEAIKTSASSGQILHLDAPDKVAPTSESLIA